MQLYNNMQGLKGRGVLTLPQKYKPFYIYQTNIKWQVSYSPLFLRVEQQINKKKGFFCTFTFYKQKRVGFISV